MEKEKGFLLLKPKISKDTVKIARAIAMCKGVRKVFLTTGEYAFVAAIETTTTRGISEISHLVKKAAKCAKSSAVVLHYFYRKGGWTR